MSEGKRDARPSAPPSAAVKRASVPMTEILTRVLEPDALERLKKHQYKAEGSSLLEPYMQPFWIFVVELMPTWLAPNLITLIGLAFIVASSCVLFVQSDQGAAAPASTYVIVAACVFVYQTLDAIDGKQARRTKSASPLGEMFDHGCDAITCGFVTIAVLLSLQLWGTGFLMGVTMVATGAFYMAHWQTYVTGKLSFSRLDVTETQFLLMAFHLATAIYGPGLWATELALGLTLNQALAYACLAMALQQVIRNFTVILDGGVGQNGTTVADTSVLSPLLPIAFHFYACFHISQYASFKEAPVLGLVAMTFASAKLTIKLVVAAMTKSRLPQLDAVFLPAVAFYVNWCFGGPVDETLLLRAFFVFTFYSLSFYCYNVIREICSHLGIQCFRIKVVAVDKAAAAKAH